ncbi:MAG: hypothetical protein WCO04_07485 [Pseudomonadota bacterium]
MTDTKTDESLPEHIRSELLDTIDMLSVAKNFVELIFIAHDRRDADDCAAVAAVANGAVLKLEEVADRLEAVVRGDVQ